MPAERYFYSKQLEHNTLISIEDQEFHHLIHVMRSRVGDEIEVINGLGLLATGKIHAIEKKRALIAIEKIDLLPSPSKILILAQAIPRLSRLECILEKSTELGVSEIWLFPAARSEKKEFSENQLERLHGIIMAATKQCGRLYLPQLKLMPPLKQWEEFPSPSFFGDVKPLAPLFSDVWQNHLMSQKACFYIGPESGFTEQEIDFLQKHGVEGVKLHSNILRTDTAAIAALSLLSHYIGYITTPL